jgi:hypothetical protein
VFFFVNLLHPNVTIKAYLLIQLGMLLDQLNPATLNEGEDFRQNIGIKVRCYWEHPWGTHWKPREHIGNLMGTH